MAKIGLQVQSKAFMKQLGKKSNLLQITAAETLNEAASEIDKNYQMNLKRKSKLRNKFSLNSVKIFKAHGVSKSGQPRQLSKIDAVVGVRKMKGNKEHYLAKAEEGGTTRGNPKTKSKVPIPLQAARIGKSDNRAISAPNRLTRSATQTLKVYGKNIGVRGDGYNSTRKRWAAVYRGVKSGKIQGDPKKPFYMIGNNKQLGIFKMTGRKIKKIRTLDKSTVRRKAVPNFQKAVKQMPPREIQKIFVKNAKRKLGR